VDSDRQRAEQFGRPGAIYFLSDRPDTVGFINRLGVLRNAMAKGTILPHEIEELERDSTARKNEMNERIEFIADRLIEHISEPVFIRTGWAELMTLVGVLIRRGIAPGSFHPDSIIEYGAGRKAVPLPDDFTGDPFEYFKGCQAMSVYSMSEINTACVQCPSGRWHMPAQLLLLVLDETGERVLNPDSGRVTGRSAFFDTSLTGRWGGVITSDRIEADFSPCPCGLPSTSVISVGRFSTTGDDDKLTCAGTIASYIRGVIAT
jgi:hypothetical protein